MADTPISVTAGSVLASSGATKAVFTAGATIAAGQVVYLDSATNTVKLADSNATAATAAAIGVALDGASANQPVTVCTEDPDFTPGATLSISVAASSGVYMLSATPGGIKPLTALTDMASGEYPVVLMIAKSATKASLKIFRNTVSPAALTA